MKPFILKRRELLQLMSAAGLGTAFASRVVADETNAAPARASVPEGLLVPNANRPRHPALLANGQVLQPAYALPVHHETDVLVVGGGPAGFAAAVAAGRAGARTTLVERYGYLGGQWTGGLVLLVIGTHATVNGQSVQTVRGIGGETLERLARFDGAIVNHTPGKVNPTVDPEATKVVMDDMLREARVRACYHCWAVDTVMDDTGIRGVVFESKSGRQAILARVIVDATGDGDIFAAAGAEHEQRLHAIGLVHRLGNTDRADMAKLKAAGINSLGSIEPLPGVRWVNLRGPSTDALDIEKLTQLEMDHRRAIWDHVQRIRRTPGGEAVFLLQTAPQLGVRISRLLTGTQQLTRTAARAGRTYPDTIAVGGAQSGKHIGWPIPYGVLVPRRLDNLLAAGRCVCCDEGWIEDMRLIGACLLTGHAAGAAAALAVKTARQPRAIDVPALQKLLVTQGAYLG